MKRFDKSFFALLVAFLAFCAGAFMLQYKEIKRTQRYVPYRDSLYLPSEEQWFPTLGYDMIMADFLWLRSIQAFGGHWTTDRQYEPIFNMFNVITNLDPFFIDAYLFGNLVIGEEAGQPQMALELIDKGIVKTYNDTYMLGYIGGYFSYWMYGDAERARYYYRMATRADDCPGFVNRLIGYMEEKSGNYHIAFQTHLTNYLRAIDNGDEVGEEISEEKLRDVLAAWFYAELESMAHRYEALTGEGPDSIEEIYSNQEAVQPIDAYDIGLLMQLVDDLLRRGEKLEPHNSEILEKIHHVYTNPPPEPHGYWFFIDPEIAGEGRYVLNAYEIRERMRDVILPIARRRIQMHYDENGEFPTIEQIFEGEESLQTDPFGNPWQYDRSTGTIGCAAFPEI